jgi:hypothetical protein
MAASAAFTEATTAFAMPLAHVTSCCLVDLSSSAVEAWLR